MKMNVTCPVSVVMVFASIQKALTHALVQRAMHQAASHHVVLVRTGFQVT